MKMKVTSNEASKLLRSLNAELGELKTKESRSCIFNAALGEDVESVRPAYDYAATQARIVELENKVIKLKHQLNLFNSTTEVPGLGGMTIDQALILIPMLSSRIEKYSRMATRLPKERAGCAGGRGTPTIIDYIIINYQSEAAQADYKKSSEELIKVQNALDIVNTTLKFEIDI